MFHDIVISYVTSKAHLRGGGLTIINIEGIGVHSGVASWLLPFACLF